MLDKEKDFILEIGEQCLTPHGMPFVDIKKKCRERELVFDDIMSIISKIKCFEIVTPTNSQCRIKVDYKERWRQTITEYFDEINRNNIERKLKIWASIITICISVATLFVTIICR